MTDLLINGGGLLLMAAIVWWFWLAGDSKETPTDSQHH